MNARPVTDRPQFCALVGGSRLARTAVLGEKRYSTLPLK